MVDRTRSVNAWIADHNPLTVVALPDPVIDTLGHDVSSDYVETFWLPILGPSAVWAARRLSGWLEESDEVEVELATLGGTLGLGQGVGRNAPIVRTLGRLVMFNMAAIRGSSVAVRSAFPPLSVRYLGRLPEFLVEQHDRELEVAR